MKNQYFGDINDYRKYGLLRCLSGGETSLGVCWMLTPSDGRTDGQKLSYLDRPGVWRSYDPELFDHLHKFVKVRGERDVRLIETSNVLPRAIFYSKLLRDTAVERREYFVEMLNCFDNLELVFFDPDNGLEVPSKLLGRKDSNKYLYWDELTRAYSNGHSVLVYQHFIRENRDIFVHRMANAILDRTGAAEVHSFRTADVVFLLASRPEHAEYLGQRTKTVTLAWEGQVAVDRHTNGQGSIGRI